MAGEVTDREVFPVEVVRVRQVTPHLRSVVVGGAALASFPAVGFDQAVRLFLPRPEETELLLPEPGGDGWLAAFRAIPEERRPRHRIYTVRSFDPHRLELEVELVVHGDTAPASRFALHARPGDRLGLLAEGARYQPGSRVGRQLLVAEESGLPAALGVLESAPRDLAGDAWLEVPAPDDVREVAAPPGVTVRWLPRTDPHDRPGRLALATLLELPVPEPLPAYAWLVGERTLATEGRRHLVRRWGMDRDDVEFVGYWRHGEASSG